jgi:hypothetical protein
MVGVINLCSVYLNGNILILNNPALNGAIFNPKPTTVTIPPGNNTFSFYCTNGVYSVTPVPSGFFCSCFTSTSGSGYIINSNPSVLFSTSSSLTGWSLSITGYKINDKYMIDSFNPVSVGDNWAYNTNTYGNTNLKFTYDVSGIIYDYDIANMFDINYNSNYGPNPSTNGNLTTNYFIMYNGLKTDIGTVLSTQTLPPPTYNFTTINNVSIKSTYINTYNSLQNLTYNNCMSKDGKYQIILASCTTNLNNNTITYYYSSNYGQSFSLRTIANINDDYLSNNNYTNDTNIMSILNCSMSGNGQYVYIYFSSGSLIPLKSADYGTTYTSLGNNFSGQYGSVVVSSTGQYVFFVDAYGNYFYFSSDNGVNFVNKSSFKSSMGSAGISGNDNVFCYSGGTENNTANIVYFWNNKEWITDITNNTTTYRKNQLTLSSVNTSSSTTRNMILSNDGTYIGVFYYPNVAGSFYNFSLLNTQTLSETRFNLGASVSTGCIINSLAANSDFSVFYAIKMWTTTTSPDFSDPNGSLYVSTNLTSLSPTFTPVKTLTSSPFYSLANSNIKTFMMSENGKFFTAVKASVDTVTSIYVDGNSGIS